MPRVRRRRAGDLGKALITGAASEAFINVKGIDPALEPSVTDIAERDAQGQR